MSCGVLSRTRAWGRFSSWKRSFCEGIISRHDVRRRRPIACSRKRLVRPVASPHRNQLTRQFSREVAAAVEAAIANRTRALVEKGGKVAPNGVHRAAGADERWPTLDQHQWAYINRVLARTNGNKSEAAAMLGLHRRSLQRLLRRNKGAGRAAPQGCHAASRGTRGQQADRHGRRDDRPRVADVLRDRARHPRLGAAASRGQRTASRALARPRAQHVRRQGESLRAQAGAPRQGPRRLSLSRPRAIKLAASTADKGVAGRSLARRAPDSKLQRELDEQTLPSFRGRSSHVDASPRGARWRLRLVDALERRCGRRREGGRGGRGRRWGPGRHDGGLRRGRRR